MPTTCSVQAERLNLDAKQAAQPIGRSTQGELRSVIFAACTSSTGESIRHQNVSSEDEEPVEKSDVVTVGAVRNRAIEDCIASHDRARAIC
jgi:hypothetical protein